MRRRTTDAPLTRPSGSTNRRSTPVAIILPLTILLAGCASTQIQTDLDQAASFTSHTTYGWTEVRHEGGGRHPALEGPLVDRRLRDEIDAELSRLGYTRVLTGRPDISVAYRLLAQPDVVDFGPYAFGFRHLGFGRFGHHGFGHLGHGGGTYYGGDYYHERLRGTLVLDIYDGRRNTLIWRGWAERILSRNPSADEVADYVRDAVHRLLAQFPGEPDTQADDPGSDTDLVAVSDEPDGVGRSD
jgi:hypothetical protein